MSSSSAMPYDGIYEVTCDELYGEPYAEFYDNLTTNLPMNLTTNFIMTMLLRSQQIRP
ncbi:3251_t:CDS:1, partial [Gigaspora rosea]